MTTDLCWDTKESFNLVHFVFRFKIDGVAEYLFVYASLEDLHYKLN